MLLADTRGITGPECPFKMDRILQFQPPKVSDKVTDTEQGDREMLSVPAAVKLGYKNQIRWSAQTSNFNVRDRIFSQLVSDAIKCEDIEAMRIQNLDSYHNQRKRGTAKDYKPDYVPSSEQSILQ